MRGLRWHDGYPDPATHGSSLAPMVGVLEEATLCVVQLLIRGNRGGA